MTSTVTIENTHRLLTEDHRPLPYATLHGAAEIAVPTLVSTLSISCVFVSVVFLHGPAKYLFTPLGFAVVFAMLASYGFSRTLTPIMIGLLLKGEQHGEQRGSPGFFGRIHQRFERGFENMRTTYAALLHTLLTRRIIVPIAAVVILALGGVLFMFVGRDFFPLIDGGQIQLHVRAPAGTRIEKTEQIFQAIEDKIREVVPERDRDLIVDNIGLPARSYNFAFGDGTATGLNDGVILVALKEGHAPTQTYVEKLRQVLPAAFPELVFYFQAADMVTQILNFGIPAQIDVRTVGYDRTKNLRIAKELRQRLAAIPGLADVHLQQEVELAGIFRSDRSGARYPIRADCQQHRAQLKYQPELVRAGGAEFLDRSEQRNALFSGGADAGISHRHAQRAEKHAGRHLYRGDLVGPQHGAGISEQRRYFKRDAVPTNANQANVQPVYEIFANAEGRDLGALSGEINKIVAEYQKQMSPGNRIEVTGQIVSMNDAFRDLAIGILFAAVFVYLLMVVNYQTWGDPLVVILALPATFCGIVTMLYVTGTTLNVPSLMGAIMAIGVASANSILLVTFAREQQLDGKPAFEAAIAAGRTQIRPVLMTAAAMIVGMIPMAIGGPGEEQNAALARAVIGGLLFATPTTLLVVPYLFAWLRKGNDNKAAHGVFEEEPT